MPRSVRRVTGSSGCATALSSASSTATRWACARPPDVRRSWRWCALLLAAPRPRFLESAPSRRRRSPILGSGGGSVPHRFGRRREEGAMTSDLHVVQAGIYPHHVDEMVAWTREAIEA